jgi:integrase
MALTNKLKDKQLEAAKPRAKSYALFDGGGLYLWVQSNGVKLWRQKYRLDGKAGLLSYGTYGKPPLLTLADARALRDAALEQIKRGEKPLSTRQAARVAIRESDKLEAETAQAEQVREQSTFEAIGREWLAIRQAELAVVTYSKVLTICERHLFAEFGSVPIQEVTGAMLGAAMRKLEDRGVLEIAKRALQYCSAIFRYAMRDDRATADRAAAFRGQLKTRKVTNQRALKPEQLGELIRAIRAYDGEFVTRCALELTLFTACRTGEILGALWSEIELARAQWTIAAERMKMRRPHTVYLSTQALQVLESVQAHTGACKLVFASPIKPTEQLSENTMLYAVYRIGFHKRSTVHGFRSLFSSTLNELGFDADVIERALAHGDPDKIRSAYNRAEYASQRRELMQAWADICELSAHGVSWEDIRLARDARIPFGDCLAAYKAGLSIAAQLQAQSNVTPITRNVRGL